MRKIFSCALILSLLVSAFPGRVLAAGGRIITLNAWGGWASGTPVNVQSTITADSKIANSNLYYTISLGGTIYDSHTTPLTAMAKNETRNDAWETVNSGWPEGDYTITVCWSTGNSQKCDIDGPRTTTVHFVPTLGWGLSLAGLAFLFYFLWRHRKEFEPAAERVRG
jgi:hypothetical protein